MSRVYVIVSGKGGVGKTTTAINLAAALNSIEEDVVVVDANLSTPNIGVHFGAPIVPINLNHVLRGEATPDEAVYEHESGTKIVPSSLSLSDIGDLDPDLFIETTEKLKRVFSHVILDSSPGISDETRIAVESADDILIVVNPNILSVTDALKTVKFAEELGKNVKGVIITRVKFNRDEMPLQDIKDMLEIPILGIVPEDKHVPRSLVKKNAVVHTKPRAKSAKAYKEIATKIAGRKPVKKKGFFSRA